MFTRVGNKSISIGDKEKRIFRFRYRVSQSFFFCSCFGHPKLKFLPPNCGSPAVWPDWAICCTLGNFFKPLATINLLKSLTFLGNFCKGIKIYHLSSEIIFGQLLQTFGIFIWSHWFPYFAILLYLRFYFYLCISISFFCTKNTFSLSSVYELPFSIPLLLTLSLSLFYLSNSLFNPLSRFFVHSYL